jgi:replicative DNA helicase
MKQQNNDVDDIFIGLLINDNSFIDKALLHKINENYFNKIESMLVYKSIVELQKQNNISSIDITTIFDYMKDKYKQEMEKHNITAYIAYIATIGTQTSNFYYYLDQIKHRKFREILSKKVEHLHRSIMTSKNEDTGNILKQVNELSNLHGELLTVIKDRGKSFEDLSQSLYKDMEEFEKNPAKLDLLKTGIPEIDRIALFTKGTLALIWGRTGMGKSTVVLNMVYKWALKGLNIIFFALEQSAKHLYSQIVSIVGNFNRSSWFRKECIDYIRDETMNEKFKKTLNSLKALTNIKIVDDPYISVNDMQLEAKKFHADIVVIDNMNNIAVNPRYREHEYTRISTELNAFAISQNMLILLIQQANNSLYRPKSHDNLKYASGTGEKATISIGVYYPGNDLQYDHLQKDSLDRRANENGLDPNNLLYLYSTKGRYSGAGSEYVKYNARTGKIDSLEKWS